MLVCWFDHQGTYTARYKDATSDDQVIKQTYANRAKKKTFFPSFILIPAKTIIYCVHVATKKKNVIDERHKQHSHTQKKELDAGGMLLPPLLLLLLTLY